MDNPQHIINFFSSVLASGTLVDMRILVLAAGIGADMEADPVMNNCKLAHAIFVENKKHTKA